MEQKKKYIRPSRRGRKPRPGNWAGHEKLATSFYMPLALNIRLTKYLEAKYPGQQMVRNAILSDALDQWLTKEGF